MKVAFYAPLKSPNHPTPSGDRTLARQLMSCLSDFCEEVTLASECRSLEKRGDEQRQKQLIDSAETETARLLETYQNQGQTPDIWFTYHLYYKAPDLIGPSVSKALNIPYVAAEASRAPKRATGPWQLFHKKAEAAIDHASIIFHLTKRDRECLELVRPEHQRLVHLPPFIEPPDVPSSHGLKDKTIRLITIAMMRSGDKMASYTILANTLTELANHNWTLDIIGDGPSSDEVHQLFKPFSSRVKFLGKIEDINQKNAHLSSSDIFIWPGINEAFGLVYLEAQALGLPVIALDTAGVPEVVSEGETGLLADPLKPAQMAQNLNRLMEDNALRSQLSRRATTHIQSQHTKEKATAILRESLEHLKS
jgi:glycosyltransferase involved in cell wall biosynthesis